MHCFWVPLAFSFALFSLSGWKKNTKQNQSNLNLAVVTLIPQLQTSISRGYLPFSRYCWRPGQPFGEGKAGQLLPSLMSSLMNQLLHLSLFCLPCWILHFVDHFLYRLQEKKERRIIVKAADLLPPSTKRDLCMVKHNLLR